MEPAALAALVRNLERPGATAEELIDAKIIREVLHILKDQRPQTLQDFGGIFQRLRLRF